MTKIIYRNTDKILVQSPEFKTYLKKQNVDQSKIIYYPYYAEFFYKQQTPKANYKKKFPEKILDIDLEEFTSNPNLISKEIYDFCCLSWNKKYLNFYNRKN